MKIFLVIAVMVFLTCGDLLANKDSIGVKTVNGATFIMHKVTSGEGLYALARRYNVDVSLISAQNPGTEKGLLLGQVVLIPLEKGKSYVSPSGSTVTTAPLKQTPVKPAVETQKKAVYHTVASGETLYRIATDNNLSVAELKAMNKLPDNIIEVGQKLLVSGDGGGKPATTAMNNAVEPPKETKTSIAEVSAGTPEPISGKGGEHIDSKYQTQYDAYQNQLAEKKKMGKITLKEVEESVVSGWIDDGSIVSRKSLALHKSAPPGTIIRVENPMNGKIVYVKVIASLPSEATEGNVSIKITKTAADQLGILDKYFRVNTHYSMEVIK